MRFRLPLALSAAAALTALTGPVHAEEPAPRSEPPLRASTDVPPPGARTTHLVAGATLTLASYGLAVGSSYLFPDYRGAKQLRIPIAGPWLALGKTGCPTNDPDCSPVSLALGAILVVIGGVTQAGGVGVVAEGLFLNTSAPKPAPRKDQAATLRAVPMDFGPGSAGLGVVGTF